MVDFKKLKDKAQAVLSPDKLDKASDAAKKRFGQHSDKIDRATAKAKDYLQKNQGGGQSPNQPPQQPPPPPQQ